MKISTSTHSLVTRFGHEEAFTIFADAGFEALDYGTFHLPPDGDFFVKSDEAEFSAYFKNVGKMAAERGLEIYQCHAPFPLKVYDEERDPVLLSCAVRSIYGAGYMNCSHIVVHPAMRSSFIYGQNLEECRRSNFAFYEAMFPALRETGVTMCIENMFSTDPETGKHIQTTCSRVEQMIDFIDTLNDMCGEKRFAACLDTGHAVISGSGPSHMQRALGARTEALHIQDNNGLQDAHQVPGLGKINWENFCAALRDTGYRGTFNFEADSFYNLWKKPIYDIGVARAAASMMAQIGRSLASLVEKKD